MNERSHSETLPHSLAPDLRLSFAALLLEFLIFVPTFFIIGFKTAESDELLWVRVAAMAGLFLIFFSLVAYELLRTRGLHSVIRGVGSVASVLPVARDRDSIIPEQVSKTCEEGMKEDWNQVRDNLMYALKAKGLDDDEQ